MSLGTLALNIIANTGQVVTDMGRLAREVAKRAEEMEGRLKRVGEVAGGAISAATTEIARGMKNALDNMGKVADTAQRIGISTRDVSALGFAAEQSGSSFETMARAANILSRNLANALEGGEKARVFAAMGVDFKDAAGNALPFNDVLGKIADKFEGYRDGAEKSALAQQLFGKSGAELIPLLNQGSDGIAELRDQAERLGVVLADDVATSAEEVGDNIAALQAGYDGIYNRLAADLMPTLLGSTAEMVKQAEAASEGAGAFAILDDAVRYVVATMAILKNTIESAVDLVLTLALTVDGVGQTIKGAFTDVGRDLGAVFAAFDAVKIGEFGLAMDILGERAADSGDETAAGINKITTAWDAFLSGVDNNQQDVADTLEQLFGNARKSADALTATAKAGGEVAPTIAAAADATDKLSAAQRKAAVESDAHIKLIEKLDKEARSLADDTISQLTERFDEASAVHARYNALVKQLAPLLAKGGQDQQRAAEAIRLAARARNEDLKAIKAAADPYGQLIDALQAEMELLRMGRADREAEILLRQAGADATDEQREALKRLLADLAREEQVARAADDWETMWLDAIDNVSSALVEAMTTAGGDIGDSLRGVFEGLADDFRSSIADKMSGGMRDMLQNGVNSNNLEQVGQAAGQLITTYIGGQVGGGGQNAQTGAAIGSMIGSIAGPIGSIVGSVLGGLIGGAFDDDPFVRVSGQQFRGSETRRSSPFGDIFVRTADMDTRARDVANGIADFDRAMAMLLSNDEITRVADALRTFNEKMEGETVDLEELLSRRLSAIIETVAPQWAAFLDQFGDVQERVLQFEALRGITDTLDNFGLVVARLDPDPLVRLGAELDLMQRKVDDASEAFANALDTQDAVRIQQTAADLERAIIERYEQEVALVRGLQSAIEGLADWLGNFRAGMVQRLSELGADVTGIVARMREGLAPLQASVTDAPDTETALRNLDRFVSAVDQWLSAERTRIEAWANQARSAIQTQLTALDSEQAAIMAAAQQRAEWAAMAGQAAAEAAQAAREAELAALEEQLRVAEQWAGLLDGLQRQLDQMRFTAANPASVLERLGLVDARIAETRGRLSGATGEDRIAIARELQDLLNQRLGLAQQAFQRPSPEYLAVFRDTEQQLERLRAEAGLQAQSVEDIQREIADLSAQQVAATNGVVDAMYFLSADEMRRLEEIEDERTALNEDLIDINERAEAELKEINDQARAYYTWAQEQGELLADRRNGELVAALDRITGGRPVDEFLAERARETVDLLTDLRDGLYAFLDDIGIEVVDPPDTGDPGGGGGEVGNTNGATLVVGDININSNTTDPVTMGRAVVKAIIDNSNAVATAITPALRQTVR